MEFEMFVGVDWGSETHVVIGVDVRGHRLFEWTVEHKGQAIVDFVKRLVDQASGHTDRVAVAIEAVQGAVIEALLERGVAVHAINPKQLDRFRDRHTVAGAKDDRLDAFVLADSLRTDLPKFRRLQLDDPAIIQLRELSRTYDVLGHLLIQVGNQVTEQLRRYYRQLLDLGDWYHEPWLWDLFELAPTPAHLVALNPSKVKAILKEGRIRRYKARELVQQLRSEVSLPVAPGVATAASTRIRMVLPSLRAAYAQHRECEKQISNVLTELADADSEDGPPDAAIVLSFPGIGPINGAKVLSEASRALAERNYHELRTLSGAAPVAKRTGKQKHPTVTMRRACNPRLREMLYHWARIACQHDPRAAAHLKALRNRGHGYSRALRGVADRLLLALVAALRTRTLYDPARRRHFELAA